MQGVVWKDKTRAFQSNYLKYFFIFQSELKLYSQTHLSKKILGSNFRGCFSQVTSETGKQKAKKLEDLHVTKKL